MSSRRCYDLLIVGAGIAWAMYAWQYRQKHRGARILVFDRNNYVSDLCHTYDDHGICEFRPFVNSPVANYHGVAVMIFTDKTPFIRRIEHKHFLKQDCSGTVISHEYPIPFSDKTIPFYPIQTSENKIILNKYKDEAKKLSHVVFIGRLAEYRYYDMDDIVERYLASCPSGVY